MIDKLELITTMKKYTQAELGEVSCKHALWLAANPTGRQADLSWADLSGANLSWANLIGCRFDSAIAISNEMNLTQMVINAAMRPDALEMCDWHTCETKHCLSGWARALHPDALDLERKLTTMTAGQLLVLRLAHLFFTDTDVVLEKLKEMSVNSKS